MISLMTALSSIFSNLLTCRSNEAIVYFCKKNETISNSGQKDGTPIFLGLGLDIIIGSILVALLISLSGYVSTKLLKSPEEIENVKLYAWVVLAAFVRGTPIGYLTLREKFRFLNSVIAFEYVLKLILLTAMLLVGIELNFNHLIKLTLISSFIITFIFYVYSAIGIVKDHMISFDGSIINDYMRYVLSTFISSALKAGNQNIEKIILGYFTGPEVVGVYNIFCQFLQPILMLKGPYTSQSYPKFVEAVAKNEPKLVLSSILYINRILFKGFILISAIVFPGIYIFSHWASLNLSLIDYIVFFLLAVKSLILQQFWWSRPFALATNPNISLIGNMLFASLMLSVIPLFVMWVKLLGLGVGLCAVYAVMAFYWIVVLKKYLKNAALSA